MEFGVGAGNSLKLIAEVMPAVGFDSFTGLPAAWGPIPAGAFACPPPIIANTRLVIGMFADTLPTFDFATVDPVGLLHCDADLYSSTKTLLHYVGPHLRAGCYVVFDEWFHPDPDTPGLLWDGEPRAWREYVEETGVEWDVIGRADQPWAIRLK